jgi:hypothetical protein
VVVQTDGMELNFPPPLPSFAPQPRGALSERLGDQPSNCHAPPRICIAEGLWGEVTVRLSSNPASASAYPVTDERHQVVLILEILGAWPASVAWVRICRHRWKKLADERCFMLRESEASPSCLMQVPIMWPV